MTKPAGQRAIPGDRLHDVVTASRWNSLMDMLDAWQRSRGVFNVTPGEVVTSSCAVEVLNETGSDLDRWACVELTTVTVAPSLNADEFAERHVIKTRTPATARGAKYAILQEAIPDGEIGRALICGITLAKVNVIDLDHGYALPELGHERLTSSDIGSARILYAETTGVVDALVSLNGPGSDAIPVEVARPGILFGCDTTICLDEDSYFVQDIECGACEKTPDYYVIESNHAITRDLLNRFTSTSLNSCCLEQLYNPDEDEDWPVPPFSDGRPSRRQLLKRLAGNDCKWVSRWVECPEIDGTACGNVVYTWSEGTETVTLDCDVTWIGVANECEGHHIWDSVQAFDLTWSWQYAGNTCVCEPSGGEGVSPSPPSFPATNSTGTQFTACNPALPLRWEIQATEPGRDPDCDPSPGQLQCDDSPPGGTFSGPPTSPPSAVGDTFTYSCAKTITRPTGTGSWSAGTCACGSASPPDRDGAYDGETVVVPCSSLAGGYTAQYRWELTVAAGVWKLDLVREDGIVVLGYRVYPGRNWCCLCTNSMLLASCGPFWAPACQPLTQLCLTPINPFTCNEACVPEAPEIEFEFAWNPPTEGQTVIPMPACATVTFEEVAESWLNATWVLEPLAPDEAGDCVFRYQRREFACEDESDEFVLTVTLRVNPSQVVLDIRLQLTSEFNDGLQLVYAFLAETFTCDYRTVGFSGGGRVTETTPYDCSSATGCAGGYTNWTVPTTITIPSDGSE